MLTLKVVLEVRRLLDEENSSHREIARRLGISRGTVAAIAHGRRGVHGREEPPADVKESAPPARCPTCGGMVRMPCLVCYLRAR